MHMNISPVSFFVLVHVLFLFISGLFDECVKFLLSHLTFVKQNNYPCLFSCHSYVFGQEIPLYSYRTVYRISKSLETHDVIVTVYDFGLISL